MSEHPSTRPQPSAQGMDKAALMALEQVEPGMRLGLGTGRAAEAFIRRLGERVADGLDVVAVTTSLRSERLASSLAIPLSTVEEQEQLDIAFDGADEVSPTLQLTKGLGGALLRERVIAYMAARFVILITPEKRVEQLGERSPIPIEVVPFALPLVERALRDLDIQPITRRGAGERFLTDNGNFIVDAAITATNSPHELDQAIRRIPGVVDTGLFLNMADEVLVGSEEGVLRLS